MDFLQPRSLAEAAETAQRHPDAVPIAGGTDVMVDMNFARRRPAALLDLTRVPELTRWERADGQLRMGAGVSYTTLITELGGAAARAGHGVAHGRLAADPQPRHGGREPRLGVARRGRAARPAGLRRGRRDRLGAGLATDPGRRFCTGVKRNALRPGELIAAVLLRPAPGPQQFCKVGTRNAMVIAVASFAVELDPARRRIGTGIGSAAPTPRRAAAAEDFLAGVLAERGLWERPAELDEADVRRFGELAAAAAAPIDDVRGTAAYRTHALARDGPPRAALGLAGLHERGARAMRVSCVVNGERLAADDVWEGESLLYVLRERLGLPGSKNACEQGECGSCTVVMDGVHGLRVPGGGRAGAGPGHPDGGGAGRDGAIEGPRAAACTRCSRRSSRPARCSAASARPG